MAQFGKLLLVIGALLVIGGFLIVAGERLGLGRLGLGRLPGDIRWQRGGVHIYVPITSAILVSLVLTLVVNLAKLLLRR